MNVFPPAEQMERYQNEGFTVMPLCHSMLFDFKTPIEVLKILKSHARHVFLLESVREKENRGRYSFLGIDPVLKITSKTGDDRPLEEIRQVLAQYKSPDIEGMPPFTGGLVGYVSFDFFARMEPSIILPQSDSPSIFETDLMLFDTILAFDHKYQTLSIVTNVPLKDGEAGYRKGLEKIAVLKERLKENGPDFPGCITGPAAYQFSRETLTEMVEKAKSHIIEGDIFQIVLSNRITIPFQGSLLNTYRMLRSTNPSPYMFYFSGTDVELAGASPETLVKVENGRVFTFPLAGTRPRRKDRQEDLETEIELLQDEKELAEHNMLVDLGRNDLGKICRHGSVEVTSLRQVQRFSHVMHIGSTVEGLLDADKDGLDALCSVLPAGTLSGAPKIKACSLISELEGKRRGIYGGAVGYFSFNGDMDFCIAIRLAVKEGDEVYVQSGAGIVYDSDPDKEFEECLNKSRAVLQALELQEELS